MAKKLTNNLAIRSHCRMFGKTKLNLKILVIRENNLELVELSR